IHVENDDGKRPAALGMGDEGGGLAVLGLDVQLLVDHECFFVLVICGFSLGRSIRLQVNRSMTRRGRPSRGLERRRQDCHCWVTVPVHGDDAMTQTNNRFFDEIGRLMNDAAGAAQGVKREVDALWRNQAEKILRDLDIVKREEFEAVKDMARLARGENEALKDRSSVPEGKLGAPPSAPNTGS